MKPSQKMTLAVAVLLTIVACKNAERAEVRAPKAAAEADAATLTLVAPLVKGGKLLEYTVEALTVVPGRGLVVSLSKPGGFYPDGGATDGGVGCDPSQKDEARLSLEVSLMPDAGSPGALIRGRYAIYTRPQSMPQSEADRLAAAFADLISGNVDGPVPAQLN